MKLLTAKKGEAHFTSANFRAMVEGLCGSGSYRANIYETLEAELAANNAVRIRSGLLIHHGGLFLVEPGTYDEVTYINGSQGMQRIDLIVARYTQNSETGIENGEWVVIQGTPAESDPVAPEYTVGNMQEGDPIDDCPVFEIHFDGVSVTEIKSLLEVVPGLDELKNEVATLNRINSELEKLSYNECITLNSSDTIMCCGNVRVIIVYGGNSDANGNINSFLAYGKPSTKSINTCQYGATATMGRLVIDENGTLSIINTSGSKVANASYISGTVVYTVVDQ